MATLAACNTAADRVSRVAFERRVFSRNDVQKLVYAELKAAGLGAQAAVRTIKKVVDAYTTLRANLRNGNLGKPGAKRRVKAESKPIRFRLDAAQPYDDRMLSWQHDQGTVSIWTGTRPAQRCAVPRAPRPSQASGRAPQGRVGPGPSGREVVPGRHM